MTRMLASVTSVEEALIALEGGADIIDLKNPRQGALGALPLPVIREIVEAVARRKPVSATIGDLPMQPDLVAGAAGKTAAAGVDIVKIGFFGRTGHADCIRAVAPLAAGGVRIVAVLFADADPDFSLLPLLAQSGFHGVMLDTAAKEGRRLGHCLDAAAMRHFVDTARSLRMLTGLAGSLSISDIPDLVGIAPDYLGFRGALCQASDRMASLDPEQLVQISKVLHSCNTWMLKTA